jgi:hypothetical protein
MRYDVIEVVGLGARAFSLYTCKVKCGTLAEEPQLPAEQVIHPRFEQRGQLSQRKNAKLSCKLRRYNSQRKLVVGSTIVTTLIHVSLHVNEAQAPVSTFHPYGPRRKLPVSPRLIGTRAAFDPVYCIRVAPPMIPWESRVGIHYDGDMFFRKDN